MYSSLTSTSPSYHGPNFWLPFPDKFREELPRSSASTPLFPIYIKLASPIMVLQLLLFKSSVTSKRPNLMDTFQSTSQFTTLCFQNFWSFSPSSNACSVLLTTVIPLLLDFMLLDHYMLGLPNSVPHFFCSLFTLHSPYMISSIPMAGANNSSISISAQTILFSLQIHIPN